MATIFDDMPKGLAEYLTEQIEDGLEINFSRTEDCVFILVKPRLEKWFIIIEWMQGTDEYSMINICGSAWHLLYKHMTEENETT